MGKIKRIFSFLSGCIIVTVGVLLTWPVWLIDLISPAPTPIRGARGAVMLIACIPVMLVVYLVSALVIFL